ncbi:MAG: ATP-binding protein [Bacilli bacterium]|nr:ATP-binding protein [Bacilli bacterium]
MLRRKIDTTLIKWKNNGNRLPLIIFGARQIGKTTSILNFGYGNYQSVVYINFVSNPEYKDIFQSFDADEIVKRITAINTSVRIIPNSTLIVFDEIQEYMNATTSLKFFALNGKYDVICSGSALGINNQAISSVSVGYKEEVIMHSMDFEEFLWAKGYDDDFVASLLKNMVDLTPLDNAIYYKLTDLFYEYILVGGYPRIVNEFVTKNNFSNILSMQKRIYDDYKDDLSKYLVGLDIAKAQKVYGSITYQLAKDNHKFQFTKLGHGARFSSYYGVVNWIKNAGIILTANGLDALDLPLAAYSNDTNFRVYFSDLSLLIASLDEEAQIDLRVKKNLGIYSGAIFENILAESLTKQGYELYFYRSNDAETELDFVLRFKNSILPIEVKSKKGKSVSLNTVILNNSIIETGIKFSANNIGATDKIKTFPYFLSFLLRKYIEKVR